LGGVFIAGYAYGQLPAVFALPAGLRDILIGLLAPVVATLVAAQHPWALRGALLWNLAGIADLVMAVTLGVLSASGPWC
jgi:fructose-specific phosphotransferase system IIC component